MSNCINITTEYFLHRVNQKPKINKHNHKYKHRRRRGLKKVAGAGSCNFPTEAIMGAKNINFAFKFPQNRSFSDQILHFLDKKFPTKRKFLDNSRTAQNLEGNYKLLKTQCTWYFIIQNALSASFWYSKHSNL